MVRDPPLWRRDVQQRSRYASWFVLPSQSRCEESTNGSPHSIPWFPTGGPKTLIDYGGSCNKPAMVSRRYLLRSKHHSRAWLHAQVRFHTQRDGSVDRVGNHACFYIAGCYNGPLRFSNISAIRFAEGMFFYDVCFSGGDARWIRDRHPCRCGFGSDR